jgi:hypothetical protein
MQPLNHLPGEGNLKETADNRKDLNPFESYFS